MLQTLQRYMENCDSHLPGEIGLNILSGAGCRDRAKKKGVGWGSKLNIRWTIYFVMLSQQFANTHLLSWVERAITVRVKCLAQEYDSNHSLCHSRHSPIRRAALTKAALTRTRTWIVPSMVQNIYHKATAFH